MKTQCEVLITDHVTDKTVSALYTSNKIDKQNRFVNL